MNKYNIQDAMIDSFNDSADRYDERKDWKNIASEQHEQDKMASELREKLNDDSELLDKFYQVIERKAGNSDLLNFDKDDENKSDSKENKNGLEELIKNDIVKLASGACNIMLYGISKMAGANDSNSNDKPNEATNEPSDEPSNDKIEKKYADQSSMGM